MEQSNEIGQNWKGVKNFDNFCVIFDRYYKSFISGKRLGTGLFLHPILTFLIFPYLLRYQVLGRLVTHEATRIMCFYGSINIALLAGMGTFLK